MSNALYQQDFFRWTEQQSAALRQAAAWRADREHDRIPRSPLHPLLQPGRTALACRRAFAINETRAEVTTLTIQSLISCPKKTKAQDMHKCIMASALALLLAAPAQAKSVDKLASPGVSTCVRLRMTAEVVAPDLPPLPGCCGTGGQCGRYLAITPLPPRPRYLRT